MLVKDYMYTVTHTATADISVAQALQLMTENKTNSLIVIDTTKKPIGIISSQILIKAAVPEYLKDDPVYSQYGTEEILSESVATIKDKPISEFMYTEIHCLSPNDAIVEAASYSLDSYRRALPVTDDETGELIGTVTRTCLKNALYNAVFPESQINPQNGGLHN